MKKSKIEILLVIITIILSISAVSAADIDDSSDSAIQSIEKTAIDEAVSTDAVDDIQTAENNADVLAADGDGNFTELQTSVNTGMVVMDKDYARVEGENDISISGDVTIEGNGHKIDANNLGGIFNVNSGYTLTLIGVTLINGNAENGGAVYNNGGTLSISDSYFINNTATKSGGAIYNNGGTLDVTGSTFDGNDLTDRSVNGYGGAAIYSAAGDVTISTSTITNNLKNIVHRGGTGQYTGDLSGAAVTSKNGALTVSDSYFGKNSGSYGSAILSQGDTAVLNVAGSTFEDNFAFNGGAINIVSSKYTISNSTFRGNDAKGTGSSTSNYANGGAICAQENDNDDGVISNCTFEDNTAAIGGAITTQIAQVTGCTFTNNTALASNSESYNGKTNNRGGFGGAIFNDNTITIEDSNFTDSIGRGRGLDLKNADISGSSFTNTIINVNNRGTVTVSDNVYDNDGKDISSSSGCTVAVTVGNGEVPYVTSGTIIFDGDLTFQDLQDIVDAGNTAITLTGNVLKSDEEEQTFANGILISHSVSIYAQDHTITANTGKVFTVNEGATLTLDKANVVGDGTSAIVNNGRVTLKVANPSTFTNVGEFAIDNQGTLYQDSMTTFTQLSDLIALVNGGEISIGSSKITKADDEKATFADGIIVEKDLTITGFVNYKGEISTYLDAANSGRIFSVNDGATLTLNKIILKNGNSENGGAVYVEANNNLIANNVYFIDNVAADNGGAVYTDGGEISMIDCVLDNNDVTNLESSVLDNKGGAAIYAKDSNVTLVNTNVTNNGRSELDRSNGDMINAVINLINSDAIISGGLFENNTGIYGGAIYAEGDGTQILVVTSTAFNNNKAYNGGAIDISGMTTTINSCNFTDNWVVGPGSSGYYGYGGAVAVDGKGSLEISDSNFTGNRATGTGASAGAIGIANPNPDYENFTATIDNCVFEKNTAVSSGGAIADVCYNSTISNCYFSEDNEAETGNAIYNGGSLELSGNTIEGNDAGIYTTRPVDTHVWVVVNDGQDVNVEYYDVTPVVVKITDDAGNLLNINLTTLMVRLGGEGSMSPGVNVVRNVETGIFEGEILVTQGGKFYPSRIDLGNFFTYDKNNNLNTSNVIMNKADATLDITYENVSRPDDVVITVNLTGKQGAPAINVYATGTYKLGVTVNNVTYYVKITKGIGTLTIPDLPAGEYVINASWVGNAQYKPIEPITSILKVSNLNVTEFTVNTKGKFLSDENVTINVTLLGVNGEGLNETFNVIVNNAEYTVTVSNGTGSFNVSGLAPGHYSALGIFPGNDNYNGAYATGLFTVSETPTLDFNVTFPENSTDSVFSISMPKDAEGYLLVDIDGQHYYAPVKNGTATIVVPGLAPGNYTATVSYTGDDKYVNATTTQDVSIPSNLPENALTIPESADTDAPATYSISLPADATGFLIVDVDGTKYVAALENGSASVKVPALSEGQHNVTVIYTGDGKYFSASKSSNLTVKKPVYKIENNKNVNALYSAKAYYRVLVTKDGKAVGAGENVTFKYNGKTYIVKTGKLGYATLKLNTKVKVKKYTITAVYKGVKVTNKVTIKHVIKAKNRNVKKSNRVTKVTIALKKVNKKYLKGKKITIKFNGKKYKVKTNKKGKAIWKVKKSMLRKHTVGKKYKYIVAYGKDKVSKKLVIKR